MVTAPGLSVERSRGEKVRRWLSEAGLLRTDLKIATEPGRLVLPLLRPPPVPPDGTELVERVFDPLSPPSAGSYRDRIDLPEGERAKLPRAFDVVGDIVLIRLPSELKGRGAEIGRALLEFVPGCRLVGADEGVHGEERRRRLVPLAGSGPWTTRHHENGLSIDVDLERAYFSPRLAREHARVARQVRSGERVFDLCCGVGPFALTIARDGRASRVTAVDHNPVAAALVRENARRLGLDGRIEVVEERVERFAERSGTADRVVFNLPHGGIKYASGVGNLVEIGGVLHYYEVTEIGAQERRPRELCRVFGGDSKGFEPEESHLVHPYSPREELVAYTLRRSS